LGGCMVPLDDFPATMRTIARGTPHAWANEGLEELMTQGANLAEVGPHLTVLAAFAAVLLATGSIMLRRSLTN
jgi:ABC-2 type transport system permease protein